MLSRLASVSWLKIPLPSLPSSWHWRPSALGFTLACFGNVLLIFGRAVCKWKDPFAVFLVKLCVQNNGFHDGISMHKHGKLHLFMPVLPEPAPLHGPNLPLHQSPPAFTSQTPVCRVKSRFCLWEKTRHCVFLSPMTPTLPPCNFPHLFLQSLLPSCPICVIF